MPHSSFNPQARWDRHIPETRHNYNPQELNERIEVLAWFSKGKIMPQLFIWNNKEYKIKNINYAWQERAGRETIHYFSIDADPDLYQISFNNTTLGWRLDKIIT